MLNDSFKPFDTLSHQLKVSILKPFSIRFTILDSMFRTIRVFPAALNGKFNRLALHYGEYIDFSNLEVFYAEVPDPQSAVKLIFISLS